uniref:Cytochrome P450 n=1 Tax=Ditylenchus dipsaci TaxID=166011 RepID=A0A915EPJ1_9BILA
MESICFIMSATSVAQWEKRASIQVTKASDHENRRSHKQFSLDDQSAEYRQEVCQAACANRYAISQRLKRAKRKRFPLLNSFNDLVKDENRLLTYTLRGSVPGIQSFFSAPAKNVASIRRYYGEIYIEYAHFDCEPAAYQPFQQKFDKPKEEYLEDPANIDIFCAKRWTLFVCKMIPLAILLVTLIPSIYFFYHCYYKGRKLPPGPMPFPIFGNQLEVTPYWQGDLPIVCISDYAKIVETFQKDGETYTGRTFFEPFENVLKGGVHGIVITEGELWRDQRRFALHVLRDFGLGKNMMQDRVLEEIETLFETIDKEVENGVTDHNLAAHMHIRVGSIINYLVFGYRFVGDREREFLPTRRSYVWCNQQWFQYVHIDKAVSAGKEVSKFFENQIEEHKAEIDVDVDEPATDFVAAFLKEKAKKDKSGEPHFFTIKQLVGVCFDLWGAGLDTTSTTLAWGVTYLIHNHQAAEKLYKELDTVIGSDRLVTLSDRPHLPYTNAVVNEVQRLANIVSVNVLHKTTRDVTIDGHFIPTGTCIIPQICALMYDEKNFKEADKFNPDRFLDSNGQLKKCDQLMPFSIGKRQCLGESLARMELFLFLANIFNQYKVVAGMKKSTFARTIGLTVHCPEFTCGLQKRYVK